MTEDLKQPRQVYDIDTLLSPLGSFGKFQIVTLLFATAFITLSSISELSYVFSAGTIKHRCLISECESIENAKYKAPWIDAAIPKSSDAYKECLRYQRVNTTNICELNSTVTEKTETCNEFVYESKEKTIVTEGWGVDCEKDVWMITLPGSINNAGQFFGGMLAGLASDRFGRKAMLLSAAFLCSALGTIKSFAVNYPMYIVFEFLDPVFASGLFTGSFVYALEAVKPQRRVLAGMIITCGYPLGEALLGLVQMLTLNWKISLKILYAPFLILIIGYWTMSESVRWLLATNQKEKAVALVHKIGKTNKRPIPNDLIETIKDNDFNENEDHTKSLQEFRKMFKSRIMTLRFLNCCFGWITNTFVFFGMSLNAVNVNEDKFLNFILTALIEVPAYFITYLILDRLGRRASQSYSLLLAGLACLLFAFVPDAKSWDWAHLVLFLVGKFGISIGFVTLDVYTTEMFPTGIRHTTMSACQITGKLAAILAPQTPLLSKLYKPLPLLVFSGLSIAAGILAWFFPETLNEVLPNTVEEAEKLGKSDKQISKI